MQNAKGNAQAVKQTPKTSKDKFGFAEYLPGIIFAAALAFTMIIGAYFFSAAKITTSMFLTINVFPLTKAILAPNFLFFVLCASFALALILIIGRKYEFKNALILSGLGYIVGMVLALVLFDLFEFVIPFALGLISIPIGIHYLMQREEEVKYLKEMRAGAGRIITVVCVVFALYLLITTFGAREKLRDGFVGEMLGMTVGDNIALGDTFTGQLADAIALQQQQTINLIAGQQALKNLNAKNDPDGLMLTQNLKDINAQFSGTAFKKQISNNLKSQNVDIGKELVAKFPMINFMAEYAWILYPLTAMVMMLFIGGLIVKNLAALIYGAVARFL